MVTRTMAWLWALHETTTSCVWSTRETAASWVAPVEFSKRTLSGHFDARDDHGFMASTTSSPA